MSLTTQTVRVLTAQQLAQVGGGIAGTYGKCTSSKPTVDFESCSTITDTNPNCFPD